jgi:hypothetical protein
MRSRALLVTDSRGRRPAHSTITRGSEKNDASRKGKEEAMGVESQHRLHKPPKGLFTRKAQTIASSLASKKVSPKGSESGMRLLTYFINRAGRGLSAARRSELEKAKMLLSKRIKRVRKRGSHKKPA